MTTRVLIADDHPIVLSGVEAILRGSPFEVVARAADGQAVLDLLDSARPDILVLDVAMPGVTGMDVLRTVRARGDTLRVVLLTASLTDTLLLEAIALGVDGILLKEGAEHLLLQCLTAVVAGRRWLDRPALERAGERAGERAEKQARVFATLTRREREVARSVSRGLRNRAIAAELGVTEGTVKVYLHRIYEKLGVDSRTELALLMREGDDIA